jgi:predicted GNAT superfamily acetyltransferase
LCWVPADIVAIRLSDPDRAWAWRRALRATLGAALSGGFVVTGVNRAGWYALERVGPRAGSAVS